MDAPHDPTPPAPPGAAFAAAASAVRPLDGDAVVAASALQDRLTKPRRALGRLEDLGVRLAGIAGQSPPPVPEPATVVLFAGDHGVVAEGVTPWPSEVTAQMVANISAGGAAVNAIARQVRASVVVVDVGVAADLDDVPGVVARKVRRGTANLRLEPAMSTEDARRALDVGVEMARAAVDGGARCLLTGEMGIGNTTASAALIAFFTGRPVAAVTGRGTGVDDATLALKVDVVEDALRRTERDVDGDDPLAVLASLGGLEIAALAGLVVGGAAARVPVLVDGVIAAAAAVTAAALCPGAAEACVAGHRSSEPGSRAALEHLALEPILDLGLRLGEGTGAALALPVLQSAARVMNDMATFDQAGVTDKEVPAPG